MFIFIFIIYFLILIKLKKIIYNRLVNSPSKFHYNKLTIYF